MNKLVANKVLTVGLAAIRKFCEDEGLNFMELVAKSANNTMTVEEITDYIDNFDEATLEKEI